jgi:hypothetical protein
MGLHTILWLKQSQPLIFDQTIEITLQENVAFATKSLLQNELVVNLN